MFQLLYPKGKTAQYLLNRELGGLQSQFGCFEEEKNYCLCQELNLRLSIPEHCHMIICYKEFSFKTKKIFFDDSLFVKQNFKYFHSTFIFLTRVIDFPIMVPKGYSANSFR